MKKMRRFAAIAAAAAMTACMAMPMTAMLSASALDITINSAVNNDKGTHTYEAYQIFDGDMSSEDDVYVLSNVVWGTGVDVWTTDPTDENKVILDTTNHNAVIAAIKAIDVDGAKPFATVTDAASVAKVLSENPGTATEESKVAKAFANVIAKYLSTTTSGTPSDNKITGLDSGYYLVQDADAPVAGTGVNSGARTRYILELLGESITVDAKASAPQVMKKVQEDDKNVTGDAVIGTYTDAATTKWNDVADYCIGEKVPFKLYGTMPSTLGDYAHYFYKFTDTLDKEFTLDETTIVIKVNDTEVADNKFNIHKDVTATIDEDTGLPTAATTIEIAIEDVKALKDKNGGSITVDTNSVITVEYKATLNTNAVIGLPGQMNEVKLEYSNNPNYDYNPSTDKAWVDDKGTPEESDDVTENENDTDVESPNDNGTPNDKTDDNEKNIGDTPVDKVIVFTYQLDINKTDGTNPLSGAKFVLSRDNNGTTEYAVVDATTKKVNSWTTTKPTVDAQGNVTDNAGAVLPGDSTFSIKGLDDQETYKIEEIKAPTGYNLLTDTYDVTLNAVTANNQNWSDFTPAKALLAEDAQKGLKLTYKMTNATGDGTTVDEEATNLGSEAVTIANQKGTSLPSTGGIGTTLFYVIGGTLAAGAGVGLIAKKRMKNEE